MQASKQLRGSGISGRFLYQQMQEVEAYCKPQSRTLDRQIYSSGSTQGTPFTIPNSHEQYCTLESSSANGSYAAYNSPSTVSFSPNGSPLSQQESQSYSLEPRHSPDNASGSPLSGSCITDDAHDFRHKLRELETVMFGPDSDIIDSIENALESGTNIESLEMESWRQIMDVISRGDLKQVLIACAKAVSDNDLLMAQCLMDKLRQMVSVSGEPIQRLGAYMLEGLVARLASSGSSICKGLRCKEPASSEMLSYMHILYEVPFEFQAAAMSGCEVQIENLGVRRGEALAVNFAFVLHHLPDESVSTQNHRDRVLRLVKSMSPKVVTLVEQESNTNTAAFFPRFLETLNYYTAMFESIDMTLPRDHKERINVEQHCLARDVVNIIACEGTFPGLGRTRSWCFAVRICSLSQSISLDFEFLSSVTTLESDAAAIEPAIKESTSVTDWEIAPIVVDIKHQLHSMLNITVASVRRKANHVARLDSLGC
ncbi:hypothetical protein D5086_026910 [Populus alba]|uniref:Uncharacterized protein n=1 Tax=Populus alba TaxID=43335 RepID=A0ACC4B3W4_POPAL